jgi:hypothetical protein
LVSILRNVITSHRNRETGIVETKYEGIVTFEDILKYVSKLRNPDRYPKRLLILTDAVHGRFGFTREQDKILAGMVRQYASPFEVIKDAIIINDPRTTAYSLLYRRAASSIRNYEFEIFNTREAAIQWLLS